jgi:hypothetical protein
LATLSADRNTIDRAATRHGRETANLDGGYLTWNAGMASGVDLEKEKVST